MASIKATLPTPEKKIPAPKDIFRHFANLPHDKVFDGYPHEKLLTLKYKGTGNDFVVNAEGSCKVKTTEYIAPVTAGSVGGEPKTEVKETCKKYSEVKFLTAYRGTATEASFDHKGVVKFWTNWGVYDVGKPLEFVSVVKGNTRFDKMKASVTAFYAGSNFGSGTRVQLKEKLKAVSLAQKLTYSQDNFWGGVYADLNLTDFKFTHYNALLGYKINKNIQVYAEHETLKPKEMPHVSLMESITNPAASALPTAQSSADNTKKLGPGGEPKLLDKLGVGLLKLTGAYKDDKFQGAAQVGWDQPNEKIIFEAGVIYTADKNTNVRAKINQDLDLCLAAKHKFSKNIALNVGTYVPLETPDKFYDAKKTIPVPLGVSLEFNF